MNVNHVEKIAGVIGGGDPKLSYEQAKQLLADYPEVPRAREDRLKMLGEYWSEIEDPGFLAAMKLHVYAGRIVRSNLPDSPVGLEDRVVDEESCQKMDKRQFRKPAAERYDPVMAGAKRRELQLRKQLGEDY